MKRQFLFALSLAASGLWLFSCDTQKVTGTVDETNASAARLLDTAGVPVANANLLVFRPQDSTGKPVASGVTQADGSYSLPTVDDGMYRLLARVGTGKVAVQDSVYTSQGKLLVRTDTVRSPGSLSGVVRMVGDDNPHSVEVTVLGSDASVVSVNADGTYRLEGLGAGSWKLKFSTSLPNYANTYVTVKSKATVGVKVDTVDLNYVGIPPVKNLTAIMDYPHNGLKLVWQVPAGAPPIRDFLVETAFGSDNLIDRGAVSGTSFVDTFWNWYSPRTILYHVRIRTLDGSLGRVAYLQVKYDNPLKDSLMLRDSLLRVDSAAQWNRYLDSLRRIDSIRVADSLRSANGSGDSVVRDTSVLSDRARDSIQRRDTLITLGNRIAVDLWLLSESGKYSRDSAGWDTATLRRDLERTRQVHDSLLAAPLAIVGKTPREWAYAVATPCIGLGIPSDPAPSEWLWRREEILA